MIIKKEIKINGMTCITCKESIEFHFKKLKIKAEIFFVEGLGVFEWDDKQWHIEDVLNNILYLGYKPFVGNVYKKTWKDYLEYFELLLSSLFTAFFFIAMIEHIGISVPFSGLLNHGYFQLIMATFIQFFVGRRFYINSWRSLKNKILGMDVLIVFSTSFAYFYSLYLVIINGPVLAKGKVFFFETSATVITFALIGKIIESYVKKRANAQLKSVFSFQIKKIFMTDGTFKNSDQIKKNDEIIVKTGQKLIVDGELLSDNGVFDYSAITGESIPQNLRKGEKILSGGINVGVSIHVKALQNPDQSSYKLILDSIRNLQSKKSTLTKRVDKISQYFVPAVILITILTFLFWNFLTKDFSKALYYSIAVAVVACPCALGLATPMSIMFGATRAIKEDVLYNKGDVFDKLFNIDVIALDKTGTLTAGEMFIEKSITSKENFDIFASLEIVSMHPIAKAFMNYKDSKKDFKIYKFSKYEEIIGSGVKGIYQQKKFEIGSYKFIKINNKLSPELKKQYDEMLANNYIVILGAVNNEVVSLFGLVDKIRSNAKAEIKKLNNRGIEVVMITGDTENIANLVANKVGIKKVYASTSPDEKTKIIKEYQKQNKKIAFVGDGVNDVKALIASNLSIAMSSGSDIALSSSDIILLNSEIGSINKILFISSKTILNIKQNLIWAFMWNGTMIPIAALGFLAPWIAALAMSVESIIVIFNASRLRNLKMEK